MLAEISLLILAASTLVLLWSKFHKKIRYWDDLGVKNVPYQFPFGSSPFIGNDRAFGNLNANDVAKRQYDSFAGERFYGTYTLTKPALVVCDPDLVKNILTKDFFHHFVDRMTEDMNERIFSGPTKSDEIWRKQMFVANGEAWKDLRSTFSPIFTSGKMKMMVPFIRQVSSKLISSFEDEARKDKEFEVKEKFGKFSMDVIASCAFGIDSQSFTNPNSTFAASAKNIFRQQIVDAIKFILFFFPGGKRLLGAFKIASFKPTETMFFYEVITQTLREREKIGGRRNDLVDMMLDALKDSKACDNIPPKDHKSNTEDFDEMTIVATSLGLLVAGYDTTGQTLSYITYELAKNPGVQSRLQDEIDSAIEENEGEILDYGQTLSLEYLDMVFHETLRLHPALGILFRVCIKDYKLPGTDIEVKAGDEVFINVAGIHADPRYYPEPEKFNPENFSKESKANRHPYAYLAFGQGPRNCIGMRFAVLEAKMALIALLSKFNFVRCEKTVEKVTLDPSSLLGDCKEGLYIKVEARRT